MADFIVRNTYGGANLREAPDTGAVKKNLPFGTALNLIEGSTGKWKSVETGDGQKGYVSEKNLIVPAIARLSVTYSLQAAFGRPFAFGKGKEDTSPYYELVVQMWKDLDMGMPPLKTGRNGERVYGTSHPDWPWSAAGMCEFIRNAGGYTNFRFSRSHATYIHDSVVSRKSGQYQCALLGISAQRRARQGRCLVCQWRVRQRSRQTALLLVRRSGHPEGIA